MSEMELNFSSSHYEGGPTSGVIAKYFGRCKACDETIVPDVDTITFSPQHETYVHLSCYVNPAPSSDPMPNGMCMICWQAKAANGTCGCL